MAADKQSNIFLLFSILLALFIVIVSYAGLFIPDTYINETANWRAQALGQDMIDLFLIVPLLLVTSWLAYKNNRIAQLLWSGILIYIIYTFVLFSFAVHFNYLFIIYCITLGLAFYTFLYFLILQVKKPISNLIVEKIPVKTIGFYLIILSACFYFLWLSEILSAIVNKTIPATITEAGLITNPVHVLDLSVLLPGLIIIAILLLKRSPLGILLVPAALTFCLLMDITIAVLIMVTSSEGIYSVFLFIILMGILALISSVLLIWYLKSFQQKKV
jgi:hypothetical protein